MQLLALQVLLSRHATQLRLLQNPFSGVGAGVTAVGVGAGGGFMLEHALSLLFHWHISTFWHSLLFLSSQDGST